MIPAGSQRWRVGDKITNVEPGPALRMDLGAGAFKELAKPKHGTFPGAVAVAGVAAKVERAQASREEDLVNIRKMLAGDDYQDANPTAPCEGYDAVNAAYHALFCGAAMLELALDGKSEALARLLEAGADEVNTQNPVGS